MLQEVCAGIELLDLPLVSLRVWDACGLTDASRATAWTSGTGSGIGEDLGMFSSGTSSMDGNDASPMLIDFSKLTSPFGGSTDSRGTDPYVRMVENESYRRVQAI